MGNDQIQYNATAIAAIGLVEAYLRTPTVALRDKILHLAADRHAAVLRAITHKITDLESLDARLLKSIARICMATSAHPRRDYNEEQEKKNRAAYNAPPTFHNLSLCESA